MIGRRRLPGNQGRRPNAGRLNCHIATGRPSGPRVRNPLVGIRELIAGDAAGRAARGYLPAEFHRMNASGIHAQQQKISEVAIDAAPRPPKGTGSHRRPTSVEIGSCRLGLFARRAGVHVDFHANRHFHDFWSFPSHLRSPYQMARQIAAPNKNRAAPPIAQAGICSGHLLVPDLNGCASARVPGFQAGHGAESDIVT